MTFSWLHIAEIFIYSMCIWNVCVCAPWLAAYTQGFPTYNFLRFHQWMIHLGTYVADVSHLFIQWNSSHIKLQVDIMVYIEFYIRVKSWVYLLCRVNHNCFSTWKKYLKCRNNCLLSMFWFGIFYIYSAQLHLSSFKNKGCCFDSFNDTNWQVCFSQLLLFILRLSLQTQLIHCTRCLMQNLQ